MADLIKYEDDLRTGTDKLNASIRDASKAKEDAVRSLAKSLSAEQIAQLAKLATENTQQQLDNIIIESGTSDAETIQARGDYNLLYQRLNASDKRMAKTYKEINERRLIPRKRAILTIDSDDGMVEDYTVLFPFLEQRGVPATICIPPERIGLANRLSWEQVKKLVDAGWSIGSHTINEVQLGTLPEDEVDRQCRLSKKMIEGKGFKCDYLAYPNGSYNDMVQRVAKKYYKASSTINSAINNVPVRSQQLNRSSLVSVDIEYIKGMIDAAVRNNGWYIIYTHADGFANDPALQQKLSDIIDYAKKQDIDFMNHDDAWEEMGNLIDLGLYGGSSTENHVVSFRGDTIINNNRIVERIIMSPAPSQHGITINTPITNFAKNAKTLTQIDQARANGFPENKSGTLITNYIIEWDRYPYQEYHIYGENKVYRRYWNLTGWGKFVLIANGNICEGTRTVGNWAGVTINFDSMQIQPDERYTVLFAPTWDAGSIWASNITTTGFFVNWSKNPPTNTLLGFKIIRT